MAKKWIAKATSKNKGVFKKQAKAAGKSTAAFAQEVLAPGSQASKKTKKRAQLAETLIGMNKG